MIYQILKILAGLSLFLVGMFQLGNTVQRILSVRVRESLRYVVKKPVFGTVIGFIATVLAQSSSIVSIFTVGMVGAGLISLYHSLGVLLGADVGTAITAQLVALNITSIAPVFIVIGAIVWLACKDRKKIFGKMIFYFGLLFYGLNIISETLGPLKDNLSFIQLFQGTNNRFFGLLVGLITTLVVHASAIPVSILVLLSQRGLIGLAGALPIILGANIGTTITAVMASLGTNIKGKRVAMAHFLFKFSGAIIILILITPFTSLIQRSTASVPQQIVLSHLFFNIFIFIIFLPLLKPFSKLIEKLLPGQAETLSLWPEWLTPKSLNEPSVALDAVRKELKRQMLVAKKMFITAADLIENFKPANLSEVLYYELVVNNLQKEIALFLDKISEKMLGHQDAIRLLHYAPSVDEIERIGDLSVNIAKLSKYKRKYGIKFSEEADQEVKEICTLVHLNIKETILTMDRFDQDTYRNILAREDKVDQLVRDSKEKHFQRFIQHICRAEAGPIFMDMLVQLERISDHSVNILEFFAEIDKGN